MKRFILDCREVKELSIYRKLCVWRPIKPQPVLAPSGFGGVWEWPKASVWVPGQGGEIALSSWVRNAAEPLGMVRFCPFGKIGNTLWLAETYLVNAAQETLFRADWEGFESSGMGWQPAQRMPQHMSRAIVKIAKVRALWMKGFSEQDATEAGFAAYSDFSALQQFLQWWDERFPAFPSKKQPWLWGLSIEVCDDR